MKIAPGSVGHVVLAVGDPNRTARFWLASFELREEFRFPDGVAIGNDAITLVFVKGVPAPQALGHMSFHLPDMAALRRALEVLQRNGVAIEDPGDEIGPEAPGSPHMGLWFHDPDGYRWELSVQNGASA